MSVPFPLRMPAGKKIRMLRERKGWSQETLAERAHTTRNWVSHIELGYRKVKGRKLIVTPDVQTIYSIVDALHPAFGERRSILDSYGLDCPIELPTHEEIEWACHAFHTELGDLIFPAYLLDCGLRLHAWNSFVLKVINLDSSELEPFKGRPLAHALYDEHVNLIGKIANRTEVEPMLRRAFRYVIWPYLEESWARIMISAFSLLGVKESLFSEGEIPARPTGEIHFRVINAPLLKFMIVHEPYIRDDRFRVTYYYPANDLTREQLEKWKKEM